MQIVVKLRSNRFHLGQAEPRDLWKVVVLVVVSNVESDPIQRSVVRVGLLAIHKGVVLRDEVTCYRV